MSKNKVETSYDFEAVTWNVYHSTNTKVLNPILQRQLAAGVTFFFMQEADGDDITKMLEGNGLQTFSYKEWRLAWVPEVWQKLSTSSRQLSKVVVKGKGSREFTVHGVLGRFKHKPTGKRLKALSYHTPAHVQRPEWNRGAPNRWEALQESFETITKLAKYSRTKHLLFAGDDNVDETKKGEPSKRWEFMLGETGMTQIQAPGGTKGKRRIDDFRFKNLVPVGKGRLAAGGGDHKLFACKFRFV